MAKPSVLEEHLDVVGHVPDKEVGTRFGMTAENVRAWRKRRGIPAAWRGEAPAAAAELSVDAPEEVAETAPAGPAVAASEAAEAGAGPRPSAIDRYSHLLGLIPDVTIAYLSGLKVGTVGKARAKRGLPPPEHGDDPAPRHRKSKMDPYLHMLGKFPDNDIADLSGVSAKNVSNFRRRHSIPSARQLQQPAPVAGPADVARAAVAAAVVEPAPPSSDMPATPPLPSVERWAYKAVIEADGGERVYMAFGATLAEAAAAAQARLPSGARIRAMEVVAPVL